MIKEYGSLRSHQADILSVAQKVLLGTILDRIIVASVTPGGGKTLMAALYADVLMDAGDIEQIVVVVPSNPLARQMRHGFHDPERGLHRYLGDRKTRGGPVLDGFSRPSGRVLTYQSIHADPNAILRRVKKRRTLVILDEPHHLAAERSWAAAIAPAVAAAHRVLMMSGTLSRSDGERIPFVPYEDGQARVHVRYARQTALVERAILPIAVRGFGGKAFYEHRGQEMEHELSTAPTKEQARALKTALLTHSYVDELVLKAMHDWSIYRREKYPSKAIVVAHSQSAARRLVAVVARSFPEARPVLAISDEPGADERINEFRTGMANVLVTVKKAYEGLDVREATHLVYLGDARTFGFMDQVIARVTRVNPSCGLSWEDQEARVWVPDDAKCRDYLSRLLEEQAESCAEKDQGGMGAARPRSTFRPETAEHTDVSYTHNALSVDPGLARMIDDAERSSAEFRALPLRAKITIVNRIRAADAQAPASP